MLFPLSSHNDSVFLVYLHVFKRHRFIRVLVWNVCALSWCEVLPISSPVKKEAPLGRHNQPNNPAWDRKEINIAWKTKDDKSRINKERNNSCGKPWWKISLDVYTSWEFIYSLKVFCGGENYPSKLQSCHIRSFYLLYEFIMVFFPMVPDVLHLSSFSWTSFDHFYFLMKSSGFLRFQIYQNRVECDIHLWCIYFLCW